MKARCALVSAFDATRAEILVLKNGKQELGVGSLKEILEYDNYVLIMRFQATLPVQDDKLGWKAFIATEAPRLKPPGSESVECRFEFPLRLGDFLISCEIDPIPSPVALLIK